MKSDSRIIACPSKGSEENGRRRQSTKRIAVRPLKGIRASQPLNCLVTSGVHALFETIGGRPEFIVKHLHRIDTETVVELPVRATRSSRGRSTLRPS